MLGICLEFGWHMLGICLQYARNMLGVCLTYASNMLGICLEHAWNMRGICLPYAWNKFGMCSPYAWNKLAMDLEDAWHMPRAHWQKEHKIDAWKLCQGYSSGVGFVCVFADIKTSKIYAAIGCSKMISPRTWNFPKTVGFETMSQMSAWLFFLNQH